jgi:hypothetical protein
LPEEESEVEELLFVLTVEEVFVMFVDVVGVLEPLEEFEFELLVARDLRGERGVFLRISAEDFRSRVISSLLKTGIGECCCLPRGDNGVWLLEESGWGVPFC